MQNNTNNKKQSITEHNSIVELLNKHGITDDVAQKLVRVYREDYLRFQIEMLPFRKPKINPAGLLIRAIRENWQSPLEYVKEQTEKASDKGKQYLKIDLIKKQHLQRKQIESVKSSLSKEELKILEEEARQQVAPILQKKYGEKIPQTLIDSIMNHLIRLRYLKKRDEPRTSQEKK